MEFMARPFGVDPIFGPIYVTTLETAGVSLTLALYYTRIYIYDGASRLQHTARNLKRGRVTENNSKPSGVSVGTWSSNAGCMLISNMFSIFSKCVVRV